MAVSKPHSGRIRPTIHAAATQVIGVRLRESSEGAMLGIQAAAARRGSKYVVTLNRAPFQSKRISDAGDISDLPP